MLGDINAALTSREAIIAAVVVVLLILVFGRSRRKRISD